MYKKLALHGFVNLLLNFISSVLAGLFSAVVFGYLLLPVSDELKRIHGKEYVQNLMEIIAFALFVLITAFIAYKRGKMRTKREKIEAAFYWKFSSASMAVFIIPALVLFNMRNPALNNDLFIIYFPFLFLENALKITQLSLVLSAILANALQAGAFTLGRSKWEKASKND